MRVLVITLINSLFFIGNLAAQGEPIILQNPSFEDMPRQGKAPSGWYDCGFPNESEPDIQPNDAGEGFFGVQQKPQHGKSYLGMVVRDNDTYESLAQRLSKPLEKGKCYEFSLMLSRSELYESMSRTEERLVNYTTPIKLRIWGGNGYCGTSELLDETPLVINSRWLEYNLKFEPKQTHSYILIEAFYKTPTLFPYNGNILIDNASPIFPIPCNVEVPEVPTEVPVEEPVAAIETPVTPSVNQPVPKNPAPRPDKEIVETTPPPTNAKVLKELDRRKIREGSTIRIDKLFFPPDETAPTEDSYPVLDEVYDFLMLNRDLVVEIGGHTNTIPAHEYCDRLSTERAKSVVDYLIRKGVAAERLEYKGYGKREPLIYDKKSKANRLKNQRVEIKVLSLKG